MNRLARLAQILGINSVPAIGLFGAGWTVGTALALYWIENALSIIFIALRIVRHRRLTRKRGHYHRPASRMSHGSAKRSSSNLTYLEEFLYVAIPFTFGHGLFLALILFIFFPQQFADHAVNLADLSDGALGIAAFLAGGFVIDLWGLRSRPFAWIKGVGDHWLARMAVVHLTIIIGTWALAQTGAPGALFAVFIGFKTLVDLSVWLPRSEQPEEPSEKMLKTAAALASLGGREISGDIDAKLREAWEADRKAAADAELPID